MFLVGGGQGWRCHQCGEGGDAAVMLGLAWFGVRPSGPVYGDILRRARTDLGDLVEGDAPAPAPAQEPPRERTSERVAEATALWRQCELPGDDRAFVGSLAHRGLSRPEVLFAAGLGMVGWLPEGANAPGWAERWRDGRRLIVPCVDERGRIAELRARADGSCAVHGPKEVAPLGAIMTSVVLAPCPVMRSILRHGAGLRPGSVPGEGFALRWSGDIVLAEGGLEPVAIAAALHREGLHPTADGWPAIGGYGSGTWTERICARLPTCARVTILPDRGEIDARGADEGLRKARGIKLLLERRGVHVVIRDVAGAA